MFTGYIYKFTNKVNNKVYIGKTCNTLSRRYSQHKYKAKADPEYCYFYRAINKYGIENFNFEAIDTATAKTKEELSNILSELEAKYIALYDSHNREKGYNLTDGGEGCPGIIVSDETKQKYIELLGQPVCQYTLNGKFLNIFQSMSQAEKETGTYNIGMVIKGQQRKANNFYWELFNGHNDHDLDIEPIEPRYSIKVNQYTLDGIYIQTFESQTSAARAVGGNKVHIKECCRGKYSQSYGFIWRFDTVKNRRNLSEDELPTKAE